MLLTKPDAANVSLAALPVEDLNVDHVYQRDISDGWVRFLAQNWDHDLCEPLMISRRRDGTYWVIAGQHRLRAARRLDFTHLPCKIVHLEHLSLEQAQMRESELYKKNAKQRRAQSTIARFKAELAYKDPVAVQINEMIEGVGRVVSASPGPATVAPVGTMRQWIERNKKVDGNFINLWYEFIAPVAVGHPIHDKFIDGCAFLERIPGQTLTDPRWIDKAKRMKYPVLIGSINQLFALRGKGQNPTMAAEALTEALNKRMQKPLLRWNTAQLDE